MARRHKNSLASALFRLGRSASRAVGKSAGQAGRIASDVLAAQAGHAWSGELMVIGRAVNGWAAPWTIDQVVDEINKAGYGLTLGIHSRIDTRVDRICETAHIGNIYVNRNQIGAVPGVQPFGGEGLSGTGPKAGGPHYMHRFATERVVSVDTTASGGNAALMSLGAD